MNDLRDELIQAHKENRFLDAVYRLSLQDRDNLPDVLANLHNTSTIDVVAAFSALKKSRPEPDFFLTRWMLEKVLSELDAGRAERHGVRYPSNKGGGPRLSRWYID